MVELEEAIVEVGFVLVVEESLDEELDSLVEELDEDDVVEVVATGTLVIAVAMVGLRVAIVGFMAVIAVIGCLTAAKALNAPMAPTQSTLE